MTKEFKIADKQTGQDYLPFIIAEMSGIWTSSGLSCYIACPISEEYCHVLLKLSLAEE